MIDTVMKIMGGDDGQGALCFGGGSDLGVAGRILESWSSPTDSKMALFIGIWIAVVLVAYLIGNISPSILMAKARGIDIKKEGSGNAGTTNALRVMGKKAGVITLIVDVLKGTAAVLLGGLIAGHGAAMYCVVAVFCGHVWPVFYRFKGGKGVATAFGALMGLNPLLGLSALGIVIIGVLISKRMSVGSIIGAACFPLLALLLESDFVIPGIVLAIVILIKHRTNIVRIINGKEPVMSIFEKTKGSDKKDFAADRSEEDVHSEDL